MDVLIVVVAVISLAVLFILILILIRSPQGKLLQLESRLMSFEKSQERTERTINDAINRNREEVAVNSKQLREEVINSMTGMANVHKDQLDTFSQQLTTLTRSNEQRMDRIRETLEERLKLLQEDNSRQLDRMRETVDEKLHKTLERRLGESFKIVSDRLELVHKGLGEMQNLATGVGDLKKVLSNVKTRGILGEILLGNLLEQILTTEQYEKNVVTKKGSREHVEFAIKLPGRDDSGQVVYMPLDSKFPSENYQTLVAAYEHGDARSVEEAIKLLDSNIKKCARDIRDKYLDPPNTTDFGIMYLPIEGLYAEVVRRTGLIETLQRECKVIITGPTTLAALLNSLQMGFKTLAIEKRSGEVWNILGAVKTEFEKFGGVLKKAQEKINQAGEEIDTLVGVRTRQIQRKLKDVQELPVQSSGRNLTDEPAEDSDVEQEIK
jgi:DNA recombination protein RmuC